MLAREEWLQQQQQQQQQPQQQEPQHQKSQEALKSGIDMEAPQLMHSTPDMPTHSDLQQQQEQSHQVLKRQIQISVPQFIQSTASMPVRSASAGPWAATLPFQSWAAVYPLRPPMQDSQRGRTMQTEDVWLKCWSAEYRIPYFWNQETHEAVWEMPD